MADVRLDFRWVLARLPAACTVALLTSTVSAEFEAEVPPRREGARGVLFYVG